MAADGLATQVVRASAIMVLTYFSRNIPIVILEGKGFAHCFVVLFLWLHKMFLLDTYNLIHVPPF